MSAVLSLARPEILALAPYEHASWDPGLTRLHANELPWRGLGDESAAGLNRYPEPHPHALEAALAAHYGVPADCVLAGRGSDEGIDLLARAFCRAGVDDVIVCPPTFGMYAVAARIQGAGVTSVPLVRDAGYALDVRGVIDACKATTRLVFLCTPNNPTGNTLERDAVLGVVHALAGRALVVVDEAYLEFSAAQSLGPLVRELPHLVVLRTCSKALGLAGARLGTLIAHPDVIGLLRRIIPPYSITQLTIEAALQALAPPAQAATRERVAVLLSERARVAAALEASPLIRRVWPSDANYILAECVDAAVVLERTRAAGLAIRDLRAAPTLVEALRISVGTPAENDRLIESLA